jgi:hypothetical protein
MAQAQQEAARGRARDAGQRRGLAGGEAGVVVVEGLDDAQALAQSFDQVLVMDLERGVGHGENPASERSARRLSDHRAISVDSS